MISLAPKPKPRQNETRDLTIPIRDALNRLSDVRVARNADRGLMVPEAQRFDPNPRKIMTGLGKGGADLVGIVRMWDGIGRVFCLEVKRYERRTAHKDTREDQERWRNTVIRFGGFAGLIEARDTKDGIDQAIAAVVRCQDGKSS